MFPRFYASALLLLTLSLSPLCGHSRAAQLPTSFRILEKEGFTICYDQRSKQAVWVYQELTPESLKGDASRYKGYFPDKALPELFRVDDSDYRRSGYTRGHLAASGDYKASQTARTATHVFSNISPQLERTNTSTIRKIEERIRKDVEGSKRTFVVTGPLFEPANRRIEIEVIGGRQVWVPTGFFKAWAVEAMDGKVETHFLKIEHHKGGQVIELSLLDLERISGVEFPEVFRKGG